MNCHKCQNEVQEDRIITTDYFQVHGEQGELMKVCESCYLQLAKQFIEEKRELCSCGAPMVFQFEDEEEIISMAIDEIILPLACSKGIELLKAGADIEDVEIEHELSYWLYIYSVPDEAMIWGEE